VWLAGRRSTFWALGRRGRAASSLPLLPAFATRLGASAGFFPARLVVLVFLRFTGSFLARQVGDGVDRGRPSGVGAPGSSQQGATGPARRQPFRTARRSLVAFCKFAPGPVCSAEFRLDHGVVRPGARSQLQEEA